MGHDLFVCLEARYAVIVCGTQVADRTIACGSQIPKELCKAQGRGQARLIIDRSVGWADGEGFQPISFFGMRAYVASRPNTWASQWGNGIGFWCSRD